MDRQELKDHLNSSFVMLKLYSDKNWVLEDRYEEVFLITKKSKYGNLLTINVTLKKEFATLFAHTYFSELVSFINKINNKDFNYFKSKNTKTNYGTSVEIKASFDDMKKMVDYLIWEADRYEY